MTETDRIYTVDQLMTPYGTIDDVTNGIIAVTIRNGIILRDWSWFHVISRDTYDSGWLIISGHRANIIIEYY